MNKKATHNQPTKTPTTFWCSKCKVEFKATVGRTEAIKMHEECGEYATRVEERK